MVGKFSMPFGGIEVEEQFEHRVVHFIGAAVRLVHLIDHHDRKVQTELKGFAIRKRVCGIGPSKASTS